MASAAVSPVFPPLVWIVGFAGHRPHPHQPGRSDAELEALRPLLKKTLLELKAEAESRRGCIGLAVSVAAGADIIAAEVAGEIDVPVHIFLPLAVEDFRRDFEIDDDWWRRAEALIRRASDGLHGETLRVVDGARTRPDCYYDAGAQIVEAADAMLIVWDGKESGGIGGTADTHARARAQRIPIAAFGDMREVLSWQPIPLGIIHPKGSKVEWEHRELFAPANDAGLVWQSELARAVEKSLQGAVPNAQGTELLFDSLDGAAIKTGRGTRSSVMSSILMHGLASLLAAATAVFLSSAPDSLNVLKISITGVELFLVTGAWLLIRRLHRRHIVAFWLRLRPAAELVRSLRAVGRLLDPLFPLIARHAPAWRRLSMSVALAVHREQGPISFETAKAAYVSLRVNDQLAHYRTMLSRAMPAYRRARAVSRWCSALAIWFVFFALISKAVHVRQFAAHYGLEWLHDIAALLLPIALPLAAGIATAVQAALDSGRRSHTYHEMIERLESFGLAIAAVKTESALRRTVYQVEEVLIDEQIEWRTVTSISGH